jgi:hypothetical protein
MATGSRGSKAAAEPRRVKRKERARRALFLFCLRGYNIPERLPGFSLMFPLPKAPVVAQHEAKRRFLSFFLSFLLIFAVF